MLMSDVMLGLDLGTSGVRIAAVTAEGKTLAFATASFNDQSGAAWWHAVGEAFGNLNLTRLNPLGLAVDATSGTVIAVDDKGRQTGPVSLYADQALAPDVAAVAAVAPPATAARGATSPLARALSLQKGATRILHQADWIMGNFSGRFDVSDENNALKTGYDPVLRQWPDWIERTGLDMTMLPEVFPAGTPIGRILPEIAVMFKLPNDLIIYAGTTDGCAAFLASGASQTGDGVTSLGTTLTLKLLTTKPVFAPEFGVYSHRIGDQWLAGGASNSGGGVLLKYFSTAQQQSLAAKLKPDVLTGLDYYPLSHIGERFPLADPSLAPKLLPRPADDATFYQAMLEGIASVEALGYHRLAELGASPLRRICSLGGGAQNAGFTKIRLKRLGVAAFPALSEHAAVGAALLAWRGHHAH